MTLPMLAPNDFRIIAHRGASAYAPENTGAAFELAWQMGSGEVELDVQLTTDGLVVLCHDASLRRYGHGDRMVEEMAWAELAALDMGSWFSPYLFGGERMLLLDQLFSRFGEQFLYHIEIKGRAAGLPQAVYDLIVAHNLHHQCIITSFAYDALVAMYAIDPQLRLGWLVRTIADEEVARAEALQLFQLCPYAGAVTPAMVENARRIVPEVRAWGVLGESITSQSADIQALIANVLAAGCDGMTINWPDWVARENS